MSWTSAPKKVISVRSPSAKLAKILREEGLLKISNPKNRQPPGMSGDRIVFYVHLGRAYHKHEGILLANPHWDEEFDVWHTKVKQTTPDSLGLHENILAPPELRRGKPVEIYWDPRSRRWLTHWQEDWKGESLEDILKF